MRSSQHPPSIDTLLKQSDLAVLCVRWSRALVKRALQAVLEQTRRVGADVDPAQLSLTCEHWLMDNVGAPPTPVLNLSGVLLHSNLGRALLPEAAARAVAALAQTPINLEFDLNRGERGQREAFVEALLCDLTGAEAATVVNNNAAALLLALNTLALRQRVAVSRGELIEIGGSFRLPELMARAGCELVEIGTTNRTHLRDYESAGAAVLLKVHPSNFRIEGFTHDVDTRTLSTIKGDRLLLIDLGSGALVDLARFGLPHEPTPSETLNQGADLVMFSGDKLLGGPQCGILVGRRDLIEACNRNPLKRALRLDKMTLVAIAEVLKLYADPSRLNQELPLLRQLSRSVGSIRQQAEHLATSLVNDAQNANFTIEPVPLSTTVGSGALPRSELPSYGLDVRSTTAPHTRRLERLAAALRRQPIPMIGRMRDSAYCFDLRTLENDESARVALAAAFSANAP